MIVDGSPAISALIDRDELLSRINLAHVMDALAHGHDPSINWTTTRGSPQNHLESVANGGTRAVDAGAWVRST